VAEKKTRCAVGDQFMNLFGASRQDSVTVSSFSMPAEGFPFTAHRENIRLIEIDIDYGQEELASK
jgi:hypothetical protein